MFVSIYLSFWLCKTLQTICLQPLMSATNAWELSKVHKYLCVFSYLDKSQQTNIEHKVFFIFLLFCHYFCHMMFLFHKMLQLFQYWLINESKKNYILRNSLVSNWKQAILTSSYNKKVSYMLRHYTFHFPKANLYMLQLLQWEIFLVGDEQIVAPVWNFMTDWLFWDNGLYCKDRL